MPAGRWHLLRRAQSAQNCHRTLPSPVIERVTQARDAKAPGLPHSRMTQDGKAVFDHPTRAVANVRHAFLAWWDPCWPQGSESAACGAASIVAEALARTQERWEAWSECLRESPRVMPVTVTTPRKSPISTDGSMWVTSASSSPGPTVPRTSPRATPNAVLSPYHPKVSPAVHAGRRARSAGPQAHRSTGPNRSRQVRDRDFQWQLRTHPRYPLGIPPADIAVKQVDAGHKQDGETKPAAPVPGHRSVSLLVVQEFLGRRRGQHERGDERPVEKREQDTSEPRTAERVFVAYVSARVCSKLTC